MLKGPCFLSKPSVLFKGCHSCLCQNIVSDVLACCGKINVFVGKKKGLGLLVGVFGLPLCVFFSRTYIEIMQSGLLTYFRGCLFLCWPNGMEIK